MDNVISFTKTTLPWGWLGNMSPHPVDYNGITFWTTEHLFQALRFESNSLTVLEINQHKSPIKAKMIAHSNSDQWIIEPRLEQDLDNMLMVLLLKVDTYSELKEELLSTGDKLIVEDTTKRPKDDLFWGARWNGSEWIGQNKLGLSWMYIRELLRST